MIRNERKFVDDVFIRLTDNSSLYCALENKTFGRDQRNFHFSEVNEDYLFTRAKENLEIYSPLPFLIASELLTALNLYKITGENRFFRLLEDNIDALVRERDINQGYIDTARQKAGQGWGCNFIIPGRWTNDIATSSSVAFPVALFVAECLKNKHNRPLDDSKAKSYIMACQNVADDFLDDIVYSVDGAYLQQPQVSDIEPSNHAAEYICLLIMVHHLTRQEKYITEVEKLARFIKQSFRYEEGETVCWPYRANMPPMRTTFGERYWKSPWVVTAMMLCEQFGIVFTKDDIEQVVHTLKTNLIRNGTEVYDSLSRQAGVLVDEMRIEYHRQKGQSFSMQRLFNFAPLAVVESNVLHTLECAIVNNSFYRAFDENFLDLENYWTLEGLSFCLSPYNSAFNFKELS